MEFKEQRISILNHDAVEYQDLYKNTYLNLYIHHLLIYRYLNDNHMNHTNLQHPVDDIAISGFDEEDFTFRNKKIDKFIIGHFGHIIRSNLVA